jgi:hypothetical protein
MPLDFPSPASSSPALFQTAALSPAGTPDLYAPLSQTEALAALQALLQAYSELQGRVRELELTERLRSAHRPAPALGIDY